MLKSMTGFGRAVENRNGLNVTVEIKAVNHRYFEFACRMPRAYQFAEEALKALCQKSISRGKVELSVQVEDNSEGAAVVEINRPYAAAYISALKQLAKEYHIKDDIKVSALADNTEIFKVRRAQLDEEAAVEAITAATQGAIDSFIEMRAVEGERLCADIAARAGTILEKVELIEKRSPETVKAYRERLELRMRELLGDAKLDEQRIITETAIFADKIAVDEETVRLRSHIKQLNSMLNEDKPMGKRLDFIVQEMNREANTVGSKCQDVEIAHIVVDIKAEIEKIREQIQNIE